MSLICLKQNWGQVDYGRIPSHSPFGSRKGEARSFCIAIIWRYSPNRVPDVIGRQQCAVRIDASADRTAERIAIGIHESHQHVPHRLAWHAVDKRDRYDFVATQLLPVLGTMEAGECAFAIDPR